MEHRLSDQPNLVLSREILPLPRQRKDSMSVDPTALRQHSKEKPASLKLYCYQRPLFWQLKGMSPRLLCFTPAEDNRSMASHTKCKSNCLYGTWHPTSPSGHTGLQDATWKRNLDTLATRWDEASNRAERSLPYVGPGEPQGCRL